MDFSTEKELNLNKSISMLDQAKMQAQVLVPVIKAFREELGEERANRIVKKALRDWAQNFWETYRDQTEGSPREKFDQVMAVSQMRIGNAVEMSIIRE